MPESLRSGATHGVGRELVATWRTEAACRNSTPELFFPHTGQVDLARRAKLICDKCPVKAKCLEEGLKEREGIWGGTTPKERRRIRIELRHIR